METQEIAGQPVAWTPDPDTASRTRIVTFLRRHDLADLAALNERARKSPEWFWRTVVEEELDLPFRSPPTTWIDSSEGLPWTRFMTGARLNLYDAMVERHASARPNDIALIWEGEDGRVTTYTYRSLREQVDRLRAGLRTLALRPGDAVGVYLPYLAEAALWVLALAAEGYVFVPIFSGYAAEAVATRLKDAGARVLVSADGFLRRGKTVDMLKEARRAKDLAGIRDLVVVERIGSPRLGPEEHRFRDLLAEEPSGIPPTLDGQDPLMIIYTSGTTGRPKGAVHVQTGFPIKAAQDLAHAFDLKPGDRLLWFTDMGWMMGPWAVYGAFLLGATLVMYEGTPDSPEPDRLWSLVERHSVTHLGVSPTLIRSLMAHGPSWPRRHDLSSLRILGSTGEPWNVAPWRWFLEEIGGGRCPIINYSGGTEISGGILAGFPHLPLKPCAFTGPLPGMQAQVLDDAGEEVIDEVGELAVRAPWVGMTRGFHKDSERYLESYWSRFPEVWMHGDFALHTSDGFWYILGRSDDTIKVAGKRLGPAEAESAAVAHPLVGEAVAIGTPHDVKGTALTLFIVLRPESEASEDLRDEIRRTVTDRLGRALAPDRVLFVAELPRTRNGKILRRLVRSRYLGLPMGDLAALENPSALEAIDAAH